MSEEEIEKIIDEKVSKMEDYIENLEKQIDYEERKYKVCGYGKSDIYYVDNLYYNLDKAKEVLDELYNGENKDIEDFFKEVEE